MAKVIDIEVPAVVRMDRGQLQAQVAELMSVIPNDNCIDSCVFLEDLADLIGRHLRKSRESHHIREDRYFAPIDFLDV